MEENLNFFAGGETAGDGLAVYASVSACETGGKAASPGMQRFQQHLAHFRNFFLRGFSLIGIVAHRIEPQGSVADISSEVQSCAVPLNRLQVVAESLKIPRHSRSQGGRAHVLHAF